jgi:hypothetical protein
MTRAISGQLAARQIEVLGQFHLDQMRCQEEQEGRIQLSALDRRGSVQQAAEIHAEDVHHLDGCFVGADGAQCLEVCLTGLRSDDEELTDACPLLPGFDKFVHDPVKRSSSESRAARKGASRLMHPVLYGRGSCNGECLGQVVRQTIHNDAIAAER